MTPEIQNTTTKTSFLKGFFGFNEFITERIIKVFYIVGLVLILLSTLGGILMPGLEFLYAHNYMDAILRFRFIGELLFFILQIIGFVAVGLLSILLLRLFCEFALVIFKINENLQVIRNQNTQV